MCNSSIDPLRRRAISRLIFWGGTVKLGAPAWVIGVRTVSHTEIFADLEIPYFGLNLIHGEIIPEPLNAEWNASSLKARQLGCGDSVPS